MSDYDDYLSGHAQEEPEPEQFVSRIWAITLTDRDNEPLFALHRIDPDRYSIQAPDGRDLGHIRIITDGPQRALWGQWGVFPAGGTEFVLCGTDPFELAAEHADQVISHINAQHAGRDCDCPPIGYATESPF